MTRWRDYIPGRDGWYDYWFRKSMRAKLSDADVLCAIPYSDDMMIYKRGYYDSALIGDLPGYETNDGDRFVVDGEGNAVHYLGGVPIVLCINPSEHIGVVEPIKALIANKRELGEYVRVDRDGREVEVGPALEKVDDEDGPTATAENGAQQAVADGGVAAAGPVPENRDEPRTGVHDGLFDLTPPGVVDSDGNVLERATGFVVSQRKAADLLPRKLPNRELKIMEDKARVAEHDENVLLKYVGIGAAAMFVVIVLILGLLWIAGMISGGGGVNLPIGQLAAPENLVAAAGVLLARPGGDSDAE